jgi:hypothetical protein
MPRLARWGKTVGMLWHAACRKAPYLDFAVRRAAILEAAVFDIEADFKVVL